MKARYLGVKERRVGMGEDTGTRAGAEARPGHRRIVLSVAMGLMIGLCVPVVLMARENDVSVSFEVTPGKHSFTIPPIPDESKAATITVTIEPAPGWRIIRLDPAPDGWFGTYKRYYDGTSPSEAYRGQFSGELEPVSEPPETVEFSVGLGRVSKPSGTLKRHETRHVMRQVDVSEYGEGFVDYRDARTLHLDSAYQAAIVQYNTLVERHAGTVYAEASQFYRAQCLAAAGEPEKAILVLETFIQAAPLGLYRGEAMYEIGRLLLEQGEIERAEQHFNQALNWIGNVRVQNGDLKLPAVPDQAAGMTAPPPAAQTMVDYDLQPATITPAMVINRRTAPWYLTRLEWDTHYYLGFIAFYWGKHDDALAQFTKAFEGNQALRTKHKTTLDSFHRRLQIACRVQFLLARPEELKSFRSEDKLRFMLADFYALWEKWEPAERIYREFLDNRRSSAPVNAAALCALATAAQHQERWPEAKTYFQKITEQYPDTPSAQRAFLTLGLENAATIEKRAQLLQKAHSLNPNTSDGERALYQIGFMYYAHKKPKESLEAFSRFLRRYPESRFLQLVNILIEKQQQ